jgi:hypothetical protein
VDYIRAGSSPAFGTIHVLSIRDSVSYRIPYFFDATTMVSYINVLRYTIKVIMIESFRCRETK